MTARRDDYYTILAVRRGATPFEIRRAFRKLAMQYHPDRNPEATAAAQFKEANEAYEVLSDPQRRLLYDSYGHDGLEAPPGSSGFDDFWVWGGLNE